MKRKIITSILLFALFLFVASWFYKILFLLLIARVWRYNIRTCGLWYYRGVVIALLIALFCTMPRYRLNTSDRVQLIYQTADAQPRHAPIHHYLLNVLLPEEEICNLGVWGARILGKTPIKMAGWILDEFSMEVERGNIRKLTKPYRQLNWSGNFIMSGVYSQVANMVGLEKTQAVHLIRPKNYDDSKSYPVVFFMHGWLGNWKMYQGMLKGIDECIVVSVGTESWSGIYTKQDIKALFTKQLPFLENMGYKVDKNNLHLIGLSNGGSASNVAYNYFSNHFKSITFVSTGIHQTYPISSRVLLIGGQLDHSAGSLPGAYKALKNNGTQTDIYWNKEATHFAFFVDQKEILEFLNKNI